MLHPRPFTAPRRSACVLLAFALLLLGGCAMAPVRHTDDICQVFAQHPDWYDAARHAQKRWGTPINVLMAFIEHESGFRDHARPRRHWFLFIPLPRHSSAYGYAQAQNPVWREYLRDTGGWFKSRSDMDDALDFVGWYTHRIHRELGISLWDPKHLYIAYHQGIGGYRSGQWRHDRALLHIADGVDHTAREYGAQLRHCEQHLRCRHWYQFLCH